MPHISITEFLREAHDHAEVSLKRLATQVDLLESVNAGFGQAREALEKLPEGSVLVPLFFLQAHATFLTTAHLTLTGQVAGSYATLRCLLEYGAYACHVVRHPSLAEVWLDRHHADGGIRAVRREFHPAKLLASLEALSPSLKAEFELLYERAIDFGAHPNESAMSGRIDLGREVDSLRVSIAYLSNRDAAHQVAAKSLYHSGVLVLDLFSHSFPERFAIAGLTDTILNLRAPLQ